MLGVAKSGSQSGIALPSGTPLADAYVHAGTTVDSDFGGQPFIRNVSTHLCAIPVGAYVFPVTVNDGSVPDNSYVVSPLNTYMGYAEAELPRLRKPYLERLLHALIDGTNRYFARNDLDRVVHVNNWMLSTNLYPNEWRGEELNDVTARLVRRFPEHAVCFRSLNRYSNAALLDAFVRHGYLLVPSRQVYLFDGRRGGESEFMRRSNIKADTLLLAKAKYREIDGSELSHDDFARLETLYRMLYIDKYCHLNPQYTARWLWSGHRDGWLRLRALQHPSGRIDGVVGWFALDNILTAPIVGYDTSLPRSLGLYRMLTRICLREAATRRVVLNFSAGAGHFKRLRGGVPYIEYSAVYVRHLAAARRRAWRVLATLLNVVAVPVMRMLKL